MMALLLAIALAASPAQEAPVRLECDFGEDTAGSEPGGTRRIGFTIETSDSKVVSVAVEDPTGVFSSGNIVGFVSMGRAGARYAAVPRDEQPRWKGRVENGKIELRANRRDVSLASDLQTPGHWAGRLRYELGGAGSVTFTRNGSLTCRPAAAAIAENRE